MLIISEAILSNINIPQDILITISEVKITKDLKLAKIYFSFISSNDKNSDESILKLLKSENKNIRYFLGTKLESKYVPEIRFFFDDSFREFDKINNLVKNIK